MTRIVVIGGVAAGMSAASQAKRRSPESEVIVLERGEHVSYGACGMPYNIEDPERSIDDLVVMSADTFRSKRGIDVRTRHEVLSIDPAGKTLTIWDLADDREYSQPWDRLIIATGARAFRPSIPGLDLAGVFPLRALSDGAAIKEFLELQQPRRAAIVGAGFIGMEMSEALRLRGLDVVILEREDQVLPGFHPAVAEAVAAELDENGVRVRTGVSVRSLERNGAGLKLHTDSGTEVVDLVLVSAGVRPNTALAKAAGVALGRTGAIKVDDHLRTNLADIYAAGDCAEAWNRVRQDNDWVPLGTTANKQGKIAGANAAGADLRFAGILGTAGFKVFELEVGRSGLGPDDLAGIDAVAVVSKQRSKGHGSPGSQTITSVVFAERGSERLLGVQMVGKAPVALRVDVFAAALQAGMTIAEVEELDLAYAPPIAPVYDPILIAATVTRKKLAAGAPTAAAP